MKRFVVAALLATSSTFTFAADQQCLSNKYDGYVDASLQWYQDLVDLTVAQYPDLDEVSQWFLDGRKHHFELNREAVHYFLKMILAVSQPSSQSKHGSSLSNTMSSNWQVAVTNWVTLHKNI